MTPTLTNDPAADDVAAHLRREAQHLPARPGPVATVAARGRRRRARRRVAMGAGAGLVVVLAAAGLLAGTADRPETVRTATTVPVASGPAIAPLIVATPYEGSMVEEPVSNVSQLDELVGPDERRAWWRWGDDPVWEVGDGLVLADGRRVATATGAFGTAREGDVAVVELDPDDGLVTAVHPLEIPVGPDQWISLGLAGAAGSEVDVVVERRTEVDLVIEPGQTEPTRLPDPEIFLVRIDLATDEVTPLLDGLLSGGVGTGGGRVVSVHDEVSTTEPCQLDVRTFDALDEVRTVPVACADAGNGGLPPMVRFLALDPTGRFVAVERTTLTTGAAELSLLVVDLDGGSTTELATVTSGPPWRGVTWGAEGRLRLAMPSDDPELPPIDVPSPPGGPTVEVVPYRDR